MIDNLLLLPFLLLSTSEKSMIDCNAISESISAKIDQYNSFLAQNNLMHLDNTNIEYVGVVYNNDRNEYNYYVDFANQNGYFLFSKDLKLTAYEFNCDLPDLKSECSNIKYSHCDFYRGEVQTENLINKNKECLNQKIENNNNRLTSSIVEYNYLSSYLYNKYGTTFTLSSYNQLYGFSQFSASSDGYQQGEESVFVDGNGNSEGNCGLVSTSNAIAYYSHYGSLNNLPSYSSTTLIDPYGNMSLYYNAYMAGYYPKANWVTLHTIYAQARNNAINVGYVVEGLDDYQTGSVFSQTLANYGYIYASFVPCTQSNTTQTSICNSISSNTVLQLRTDCDVVYDGHGMMVTGYRLYSGTFSDGFISIPVEIFCISIYDGHSCNERWYDFEQLSMFPYPNNTYRSSSTTIAYYYV